MGEELEMPQTLGKWLMTNEVLVNTRFAETVQQDLECYFTELSYDKDLFRETS